jgi:hypothetical protein
VGGASLEPEFVDIHIRHLAAAKHQQQQQAKQE